MSTAACLLIDTNVWVDNYIPAREDAVYSRQLIATAKQNGAALVYPVHALKDVFYNLGATLKHVARMQENDASNEVDALPEPDALAIQEIAWGCIENMCALATAIGADESDAWKARKLRSLSTDLEDNFVMAAAERAHVDIIVTRDKGLLKKSTVPAFTPEDALAFLQVRK